MMIIQIIFIFIMNLIDIENFKTKRCDRPHREKTFSASFFNCHFYHSKADKRRNPIHPNKRQLTYNEIYVQDFYSTQFASNFVQYLYHPNIYKTIPCRYRNNINFDSGVEYPGSCPYIYCPYLHQNQDTVPLNTFRNMSFNVPQPVFMIKEVEEVKQILAKTKDQVGIELRSEIDEFKAHLKTIKREIAENKEQKKQEMPKKDSKLQVKQFFKPPSSQNQKWYTAYSYFDHGQKLPIIEDRHHEFKNFRDIMNNPITPHVMKYITAFLNTEGGVLYIGIDDSSVVYGFEITQHEFDKFLLSIDKDGKYTMNPPLMPQKYSVRRIPVYHHKKSKELWVIQIKVTPSQKDKKNRILTTYNRQCFMRMNASTPKLDALDLLEYIRLNEEQKREQKSKKEIIQEITKSIEQKGKDIPLQQLQEIKQSFQKLQQILQEKIEASSQKKKD